MCRHLQNPAICVKMCKVIKICIVHVFIFVLLEGHPLQHPETQTSLMIYCNGLLPKYDPKTTRNVTLNCPPSVSFSKFISKFNFTSLSYLKLNLSASHENIKLNASQFENLNVENLVIDYKFHNKTGMKTDIKFMEMEHDVLYVLESVKHLEIAGVVVIPAGKSTAVVKPIQNPCRNLQTLIIRTSDMRKIPPQWLKVCTMLTHLKIAHLRQRNGTKDIRRKILGGLTSLRELTIHNCYIEELEDELAELTSLERLDVAHNQIHYALTTTVLPSLTELDLSYNHIFSSALLASGVEKQPKLRVLSIDYNTVLDICDSLGYRTTVEDETPTWHKPLQGREISLRSIARLSLRGTITTDMCFGGMRMDALEYFDLSDSKITPTWHKPLQGREISLRSIARLSLRGTITTDMCFGGMRMDALEYFDLSDSKITSLHFKALPMSKARRLEVNVAGCPIHSIPGESFTEEDYNSLHHEELRITGLNVTLSCDCAEYLWLVRASKERRLVLNGASCSGGRDLASIPEELLQCSKYECGVCTCRRYWQDNSTDVECRGELHALPRVQGLRKLHAAGNLIENVTADDLPKSLIYLDLSKNHIARMSPEAIQELFSVQNRTMKFFQNPIICDCENKLFIQALMDHYTQVEDYPYLTCIDEARFIKDVDPAELCLETSKAFQTALLAALGAALILVALCVPLYYRFGKTVKVYLYSKGLCLCCLKEDDIDSDRPFDAFVSFSHLDERFVIDRLLPGLENKPYEYKICIHYRNWIAGELIPTQINVSVDKSRRTIIVLSKNFLESVWGLLEFRTAHIAALKEGRSRLIIVIIDDILETERLDGELMSYLNNNTYVKWGDPWFWDKVRYALPHKDIIVYDTYVENINAGNEDKVATNVEIDHENTKSVVNNSKTDKTKVNTAENDSQIDNRDSAPNNLNIENEDVDSAHTSSKNTASTVDSVGDTHEHKIKDMKVGKEKDTISTDSAIEMERFDVKNKSPR